MPKEIQQPKTPWQVPKEIQQPKGPWQTPGEIQVPKGIQAVETKATGCVRRLSVVGDALFDFDKAKLRPDAEETLLAAGPEIVKLGGKPTRVEGHTDAVGSDAYNMKLSEARATSVRDWLAARSLIPSATPIKGYGKTAPVAPNATADGRDDPAGRQKTPARRSGVRHLRIANEVAIVSDLLARKAVTRELAWPAAGRRRRADRYGGSPSRASFGATRTRAPVHQRLRPPTASSGAGWRSVMGLVDALKGTQPHPPPFKWRARLTEASCELVVR